MSHPWGLRQEDLPCLQEGSAAALSWHSREEMLHPSQKSSAKEVCRPAELSLPRWGSQQGGTAKGAPDSTGQQRHGGSPRAGTQGSQLQGAGLSLLLPISFILY